MANNNDKNYVSVGFWMLAMLVMAIPCVGIIMILVWAFAGENESRKNYFRALIAWFLILMAIGFGLMMLGFAPELQKQIQGWLNRG